MATGVSSFRVLGGDVIPTPTGSITTEVSIAPDPYQIELELMQIAGQIEDRAAPLLASAKILAEDTQRRFDTETDPDGDKWVPLDEEYLANKISLGYPEDILHRTGELERTATDIDAYIVTEDSVFFDTSVLPPYGLLHQTGSGVENAGLASYHRLAVGSSPEIKAKEGGSHTNLGIGRGNALPARPFIGMSEEAEGEVWAIFDRWFDEATTPSTRPYVHPTGTMQSRIGGRFGPAIRP